MPGRGSAWTNAAPRRTRLLTHWTAVLTTAAMVALCVAGFSAPAQAAPPIAGVPLGLVSTFAVLTPAAVGNAAPEPVTVVRGDIGAGGAITGFPPGLHTGSLYGSAAIGPALADLQIAFDNAKARPAGATMPAELGGTTAGPGVHTTAAASGMAAGGTFTIDGQGDPGAVFIFQVGGALALGANITMNLTGGARAENVYWAVTGAGAIGAGSSFVGTLMATTAVSSGAGSTINGRLLSLGGAITMGSTQIYSSPPTVAIDGGEQATSMTASPTITGTTSLGSPSTVSVTVDGAAVTPNPTVSETGTWSFASAELMNGNHTIVATVVDGADNIGSFTQILTIDTEPPAVTIDGGLEAVTNDLTPTISGTTDIAVGERVSVAFSRVAPPTTLTRTTVVQDDLTWNMSPNGLGAGAWTVVATVTDTAGNQNTATQHLTIDATAPTHLDHLEQPDERPDTDRRRDDRGRRDRRRHHRRCPSPRRRRHRCRLDRGIDGRAWSRHPSRLGRRDRSRGQHHQPASHPEPDGRLGPAAHHDQPWNDRRDERPDSDDRRHHRRRPWIGRHRVRLDRWRGRAVGPRPDGRLERHPVHVACRW